MEIKIEQNEGINSHTRAISSVQTLSSFFLNIKITNFENFGMFEKILLHGFHGNFLLHGFYGNFVLH